MIAVMSTNSSDNVGDAASSLDDPGLCFWSLGKARPFTLPSRFSFRIIKDSRSSSFSL